MTNREREFAALGLEYAEGIEGAGRFAVPGTGREVRQVRPGVWEAQPWNDNYWKAFSDPLEALRFATRPRAGPPEGAGQRPLGPRIETAGPGPGGPGGGAGSPGVCGGGGELLTTKRETTMTEYQGHTIEILTDAGGYYARIDGHDEPLADELPEGATEADALAEARRLVDRGWF